MSDQDFHFEGVVRLCNDVILLSKLLSNSIGYIHLHIEHNIP